MDLLEPPPYRVPQPSRPGQPAARVGLLGSILLRSALHPKKGGSDRGLYAPDLRA